MNSPMNQLDQAVFDQWLEQHATEEERRLPFQKQLEHHILWLAGSNYGPLEAPPTEEERNAPN